MNFNSYIPQGLGLSALMLAALEGETEVVMALVEGGADTNQLSKVY